MAHQKISISLSVVCLLGIAVSSLSYVQEYSHVYVIASWIKPFCTIGFVSGISIHYYNTLRRSKLLISLGTVFFSAFFFLSGFFINSVLLPDLTNLLPGIHSYILIPAVMSAVLMISLSLTGKIGFPPFDKPLESLAAALIPFYIIVLVSLTTSFINTDNPKVQWLSRDYMVKPAVFHPLKLEGAKKTEDIIYTGPLNIRYSMDFIRLYEKLNNKNEKSSNQIKDSEIIDFADFSNYFLFVVKQGISGSLLVFHHDGKFIKRIDNISNIYHSDSAVAAVDSNGKYVQIFDESIHELFKINFPPSLSVRKIVFSNELFALLYSKKDDRSEAPSTFSIIYRLDTGNRVGRIKAADIAPRIKKPGFVSVDNTDEGLFITVLDRNSNKRSYLFKGGKFSNAIILQCGADRFFVKAQKIEDRKINKEYLLVYDFFRFRKIHESMRTGDKIKTNIGNITALVGKFFLTDSYKLLNRDLREIFEFTSPSEIPFRVIVPPDKTFTFKAEGSVSQIDFSPILSAIDKTAQKKILLADIKGTLIIKKVFKFFDYFLIMTNNRIFIYDKNLQLLRRIDLPSNGYINRVKILNESILLTFYTEESISIYSIDADLNNSLVAAINSRQGKIWDLSGEFIVYGQEFRSSSSSKPLNKSSILVAKGINSGQLYHRIIISSLNSPPSVEKSRLLLPFQHITEIVELYSGKRTIIDGNVSKAADRPFGVTNSGFAINLVTFDVIPFRFDPDRFGTNIVSGGEWLDLHGYLLNPESERVFEVVRSGLSTLGNNSICSSSQARKKKIISCIDLTTMEISASFSIDNNYEIVYSDPHIVFMKDNHSIVAVEIKRSS